MGFGKTTFSKKLAVERRAVCLTHDEFMVDIYGRNVSDTEFHANYGKIDDILWKLAEKIIRTGTDVIMDYGFWSKDVRAKVQNRAQNITPNVIWHQLVCDIETAKKRVLKRTEENKSELFIDEACFNEKLKQYQPIASDEGLQVKYHQVG